MGMKRTMNYRTTLSHCPLAIFTLLAALPRLGVAAITADYASMWRIHALLRFVCLAPHMLARKVAIVVCALFLNLLGTGYATAAITTTLVADASSSTDATTYTTASITPTANNLVLAWVTNTRASSPTIPTLSGNGLTWVQVATVTWGTISAPTARTTLFRAMGAAPSAGIVTIDFAGSTQTGVGVSIIQFGDVDISGTNGSGAVVQSVTGSTDSATAAAGLSITLAALGNAANATAGGFANFVNSATSISAGAGYSITPGTTYATPSTSLRSEFNTTGSTIVNVTQSTTSHIGGIAVEIKAAITTLGNGTAPGNSNIAPSGAATNAGAFSFQTGSGTDTITAATVTLAVGTSGGLGLVEITNSAGTIVYGSATNPASDTPAITLSTNTLTATTTLTEYRIRVTPKTHANMPAPAGSSYAVTARISAWTSANTQAGSDAASTTVTIDNLSPGNITASTATAGNAQVALNWTNPADVDLSSIVVLRRPTSAVADTPAEGATYVVGNTIGTATVACVVASPGTSCTDTGLTNGTAYHYRIFTRDSSGNYSATGVVPSGSPTTPNSCPGNVVTTTADTGTSSLRECINTANLNPGTTISFNIPGPGNQSAGADSWWRITPLTWLPGFIASNTIIDGTTQTTNRGNTNSLGPEIEINGATVGGVGLDGFGVSSPATNVTIKGFIINQWSGAGISLWTGTGTVTGNYIGTNYAGTGASANTGYGIYVNSNGNTIGGTTVAERNVIAGNGGPGIRIVGNSNTVQGNYIGVNTTAGGTLANASDGIQITATATGNTIGGTAGGAGNVISGNTGGGINNSASGSNNVYGNYIGTNASSASLINGGDGLYTSAGTVNLGNASEAQSNIIGPNTGVGINLVGGTVNLAGTVTVNDDVTLSTGTLSMGNAILNVSGNWTRTSATVNANTSTVTFNATSGTILITTGGQSFYNIIFNDGGGSATYQLQGVLAVANDLTVTDGILDTKSGLNYAITVTRDFIQPGGRVLAQSSTVTVGRHFTADGTETQSGFNNASLVLNGTGTLTYTISQSWAHGFNNLTVGQSGNTTTLAYSLSVFNALTVGSGTFTGATRSIFLQKTGTPLVFDPAATVSLGYLSFHGSSQNIPTLINGYDSNIRLTNGNVVVTQLGNITLNAGKNLMLDGDSFASRAVTYNTNGFELVVGGYLQVGAGNDTALKQLNGTNSAITVKGNIDIKALGTGSVQPVFITTGSTVTLSGTTDQSMRSSGSSFNNLILNNAGVSGSDDILLADALDVNGALTMTDGDLTLADYSVNTAGSVSIGANGSIDVTGRIAAAWTFDGTSTLTDSSIGGPQQINNVVLNGTNLTLASSAKMKSFTNTAGTMNLGAGGYTLELTGTGTPLSNSGTFTAGTSTVKFTGTTTATNVATAPYSSLWLAPTAATTYSLTGSLTAGNAMTGNLTVDANATLDATATNYNLTAVNITLNASGTYLAKASTITLSGNWSNSGTFTPSTSGVVMNGTAQSITGNTTFNNFTKSVASAATLTFAAGSTTTINGTATLNGAVGQLLSLLSGTPGTRWNFTLPASAIKAISYVRVADSDASGSAASQKPISPLYFNDMGTNIDWFAIPTVVKSATIISDPVNNTTNPKAIPGAIIEYTITIANGTNGSTATNIVVTDSLNTNITAGTLAFNPNTYAAGQGVQVTAPNINGGAAQNLTNAADADAGNFNVTGVNTVTVSGIALNTGQSATVKFRVTVQ